MTFGFGRGRLLVAAILFIVVALGLTVREFMYLADWPEVEAKVTATRVIEEQSGGNDSHPLYRPEVTVLYTVAGHPQQGHAVATYWSDDRHDAEATLSNFPNGVRRTMRVNPSNPDELRFDAELGVAAFKIPLVSAGTGVFCFVLWLALRRV